MSRRRATSDVSTASDAAHQPPARSESQWLLDSNGDPGWPMCSQMATDKEVVKAVNSCSIPSEDLVSRDAWLRFCKARGAHLAAVDEEARQALCARRGYLLYRSNPRGF